MASHHGGKSFAAGTIEQRAHRVEKWQISFARSVLLDAAPARDQQTGISRARPAQEFVRKRGLPNTRLTGDENQAAGAVDRLLQESFQFPQLGLSSHK